MGIHLTQTLKPGDVDLSIGVIPSQLRRDGVPLFVREGHAGGLALDQLIQGRHGGVDIALFDEGPHESEEEGQQKGPDMAAVHVGVGHDDDLVITELLHVEVFSQASAQSGDDRHELVIAIDLIGTGFLHIQHFPPQRQDGLESGISSLGGGATCGVALHDIDFGQGSVPLVAVPELAGEGGAVQGVLTTDIFSCPPGCLSGTGGGHSLFQDGTTNRGILF